MGLKLGGKGLAILCAISLIVIAPVGLWDSAMITLIIMAVSVLVSVAVAIPVGILVAFSNRIESVVRPILDMMQVLPPFVYLIPALVLFGVSGTQSVFLTVVYSIPPAIRLTNLRIRQVPRENIETALSHGSTTLQTLFQVQLPLARRSIMMGVNQTIMMAMAMVIITALVGAGGLGRDVWTAMREIDSGKGLESGVAIVLLAIILDRLSYALARDDLKSTPPDTNTSKIGFLHSTKPGDLGVKKFAT
jgi:glycine betaine/proline transport system permease protein